MSVAVIGLGAMGQNHARIYKELGVLSYVCDVDRTRFKYGVPSFENVDELFLSQVPTAVSIAVPTPFHLEVAEKCLKAGCHVLVEKPLSNDVKTAAQIIKLARDKGKVLAVGYIERFNPAVQRLKQLIGNGTFGEITSVNIKRVGGIPRSADNVILDLMTHDFDILMNIFEREPEKIYTHARQAGDVVNSAQVLLDFGSASATCEANWISPVKVREIHVTGTGGYACVDLISQTVTQFEALNIASTHKKLDVEVLRGEPLKAELEAFLRAAKTGNEDGIVTGEEGLRALKVTLEALKR